MSSRATISESSSLPCPRPKPERAPRITCGACDMFSMPPASARRDSPSLIIWAAVTSDWMPDPHSRLTVSAGVSIGRPALRPTWRAPYRASPEVCMALPMTTWSTQAGCTPLRCRAPRAAWPPSSRAETSLKSPTYSRIGVRAPPTITTSWLMNPRSCARRPPAGAGGPLPGGPRRRPARPGVRSRGRGTSPADRGHAASTMARILARGGGALRRRERLLASPHGPSLTPPAGGPVRGRGRL